MSFDSSKFRKALGFFATGVTIITGLKHDNEPVGVTVNAFASVSLDPPLVLICLANTTGCLDAFCEGERFCVNILSESQQALSEEFAGPQEHKFRNREFVTWDSGCPVLPGCLANMECTRTAIHEGGDHFIVIGHVDRIEHAEDGRPLLYYQSGYGRTGDA
ncbi:MAG: flavin reductase family protein [Proteobacteria bacterium]|nr:flavin reductase family protein [Pseudomonadota bacterium]MDA1023213.1 flavin reductase family protein [Pseudomonadota bacterium]